MTNGTPTTLMQAIKHFSDPEVCLEFVRDLRWPEGVTCPHCGSAEVGFLATRRIWKCKNRECRKQFSVKVGTIFEDSPIGLDKWLAAVWMLANCKNGVSSYEIHRALGVTQKTAWFMLHRIRLAMQTGTFTKLAGTVEADETYVGGQAKYMHAERKRKTIRGRGTVGKAIVLGFLQREGEVRTEVLTDIKRTTLHGKVREHIESGSQVYTDELASYEGLAPDYTHEAVNHKETYARGEVHTNNLENYWCLFKRCIRGTYVSVDPIHLHRYLAEQDFRYNSRKNRDGGRLLEVVSGVAGKRLTYAELTGKMISA
jgi:transposase-like protein